KDLPSCRNISMYNVPWSTTPGKLSLSCHGENDSVAFYTPECIGLPNLHEISELNPFNLSAYGPLPNCLRLKTDVAICPPRLVTSEWLVLSRRESHPLYVTTYARSLQESRVHPLQSTKLLTTMNFNRAKKLNLTYTCIVYTTTTSIISML